MVFKWSSLKRLMSLSNGLLFGLLLCPVIRFDTRTQGFTYAVAFAFLPMVMERHAGITPILSNAPK